MEFLERTHELGRCRAGYNLAGAGWGQFMRCAKKSGTPSLRSG